MLYQPSTDCCLSYKFKFRLVSFDCYPTKGMTNCRNGLQQTTTGPQQTTNEEIKSNVI